MNHFCAKRSNTYHEFRNKDDTSCCLVWNTITKSCYLNSSMKIHFNCNQKYFKGFKHCTGAAAATSPHASSYHLPSDPLRRPMQLSICLSSPRITLCRTSRCATAFPCLPRTRHNSRHLPQSFSFFSRFAAPLLRSSNSPSSHRGSQQAHQARNEFPWGSQWGPVHKSWGDGLAHPDTGSVRVVR